MDFSVVPLLPEHVDKLLATSLLPVKELKDAYFSEGSKAYCLLAEGEPVFAGGVVNLKWQRAEAWILPTAFFRGHIKQCLRILRQKFPEISAGFHRIQASCNDERSGRFAEHLGFVYEGTLQKFGPNGETCGMYARIFEP